jgi:hypothetical protein
MASVTKPDQPTGGAVVAHPYHATHVVSHETTFREIQKSLPRACEPQNAAFPSAMFNRAGKAKMAARRPLAGRISLNSPWSRTSRKIRVAVGRGISADLIKSDVLKIGLANIQSSARTACCDRVTSTIQSLRSR